MWWASSAWLCALSSTIVFLSINRTYRHHVLIMCLQGWGCITGIIISGSHCVNKSKCINQHGRLCRPIQSVVVPVYSDSFHQIHHQRLQRLAALLFDQTSGGADRHWPLQTSGRPQEPPFQRGSDPSIHHTLAHVRLTQIITPAQCCHLITH